MIYVEGFPVQYNWFPDGTPALTDIQGIFPLLGEMERTIDDKGNRLWYFNDELTLSWVFGNYSEMPIVDMITRHIQDLGYRVELFLPYIPNARMDRKHDKYNEVFTLKYFAQWLNSLNFTHVYVLDMHSAASMMINRLELMDVTQFHKFALTDVQPDYIVFPDKGAQERYMGSISGYKFFYGQKVRNWNTGKIEGLDIINPSCVPESEYRGKKVLVIDDICSRGGTFTHTAEKLKKMGFGELYLAITHCEPTIELGNVFDLYERVYTTDSMQYALQTHKEKVAEKLVVFNYNTHYPFGKMSIEEMREVCGLSAKK